jgi:hypothetical protein
MDVRMIAWISEKKNAKGIISLDIRDCKILVAIDKPMLIIRIRTRLFDVTLQLPFIASITFSFNIAIRGNTT